MELSLRPTLSAMSRALEHTAAILGIVSDEKRRQAVARFIIRVAKEDDSLNAAALRDRAVVALGGVAYSDLAAKSQTSESRIAG
jgi:hypothetical protein